MSEQLFIAAHPIPQPTRHALVNGHVIA